MSGRNVRRNLGLSPESELTPFFTQIYRNPQTFTQNPRTFYEIAQAKNNQNLRFTLNCQKISECSRECEGQNRI